MLRGGPRRYLIINDLRIMLGLVKSYKKCAKRTDRMKIFFFIFFDFLSLIHYSLHMITTEQLAKFQAETIPSNAWLAEHGYAAAQQYAYAITSDAHKDAYGIRCRWMAHASIEELAEMYYDCVNAMVRAERERVELEAIEAREAAEEAAATAAATYAALNPAPFGTGIALAWPA